MEGTCIALYQIETALLRDRTDNHTHKKNVGRAEHIFSAITASGETERGTSIPMASDVNRGFSIDQIL